MGTLISLANWHSVLPLGEASGAPRLDTLGLNNMADVNTVQQVAGAIGATKASQSTIANQRYLRLGDTANILSGDFDWCMLGYLMVNARPTQNQYIIGKTKVSSKFEWWMWYRGATDQQLRLSVSHDGTGPSIKSVSTVNFGGLSIGVWYRWSIWHSATGNEIGIEINVTRETPLAHSTGIYNGGNATGTGAPFNIHAIADTPTTLGSDTSLQHIEYVRGRVPSAADRDLLYTAQSIYPHLTGSKILDAPLIDPTRAAADAPVS